MSPRPHPAPPRAEAKSKGCPPASSSPPTVILPPPPPSSWEPPDVIRGTPHRHHGHSQSVRERRPAAPAAATPAAHRKLCILLCGWHDSSFWAPLRTRLARGRNPRSGSGRPVAHKYVRPRRMNRGDTKLHAANHRNVSCCVHHFFCFVCVCLQLKLLNYQHSAAPESC